MTTVDENESTEDRIRRQNRERKRAQRKREEEHDEKLGMEPWVHEFSEGEREAIAKAAALLGYENQTEYLFAHVLRDMSQLKEKGLWDN